MKEFFFFICSKKFGQTWRLEKVFGKDEKIPFHFSVFLEKEVCMF